MKKILLTLFVFLMSAFILFAQSNIKYDGKNYYFTDKIVVQFAEMPITEQTNKAILTPELIKKIEAFGVSQVTKMVNIKHSDSKSAEALNRIFVVEFSKTIDPIFVAAKISKFNEFSFAEPYYLNEVDYIPNDPMYSTQYALEKISASTAWDINKGNKNIVIGIIDTGVDWNHPDLAANIWTNSGEIPNNLIDDDLNGFVDDVVGWDFGGLIGSPDNDPMEDRPDHGTLVAGCASAVSDNGVGVASIGFNSSVMAVKTSQDNIRTPTGRPLISFGYQGILYAVDNGASIINCSWGNYAYSIFAKSVIDYAVANNVLVVAAMGNDNLETTMYPANYSGVLSVAATGGDDVRSSFSNYGFGVDVVAPGTTVLSTWMDDTYTSASGTSLSSPIVAGLCGLVKAQFPLYTNLQIAEQVRTNCDDIYSVNSAFQDKLGKGRINAFNALSNVISKSVRMEMVEIFDLGDGDGIFEVGENIKIKGHFVNYLAPLSTVDIVLSTESSYATVTNSVFSASSMGTLEIFDNNFNQFEIALANVIPENTEIAFKLSYTSSGYSDFQSFKIMVNPTYATQGLNNVSLTITNKGNLGYNDYPNNAQGIGFTYNNGSSLLFEGGLIYGNSSTSVVDNIRGDNPDFQNNDLTNVVPFVVNVPGQYADEQGKFVVTDQNAGSNKLGIETTMESYSYSDTGLEDFILLRYIFKNTNDIEISNFIGGLYFDWDIDADHSGTNLASYDQDYNYALFYEGSINTYIGVGVAWWWGNDNFYAINNDGSDGGINVYDNFTKAEKWLALSNSLVKVTAGPGDVSGVISAGPFFIPANGEREIAFIIVAGETIDMVKNSIVLARSQYVMLPTGVDDEDVTKPISFELQQNYPNPFNPVTQIKYSIPEAGYVTLKIYDIMGCEVSALVGKQQPIGNYEISFDASKLSSGAYFYELKTGNFKSVKKMMVIK